MTDVHLSGSCLCGAVAYEISGELTRFNHSQNSTKISTFTIDGSWPFETRREFLCIHPILMRALSIFAPAFLLGNA